MKTFLITCLIILPLTAAAGESPYAGDETREIKALSDADIDGYLGGKGMGYARAAELNHYPGPKHVMELATELELSKKQLVQTGEIFDSMQLRAKELGRQLVNREGELDQLFANNEITAECLKRLLADIATVQGEIRYVHLAAHLQQRSVLSEHQAKQYDRLRGYESGHSGHQH